MRKHELAHQLRKRLSNRLSWRALNQVSDDDIIISYTTCSGCHKAMISDTDLLRTIIEAKNAEEFLHLTSSHKHA